jgi:hypothetical protein
MNTMASTSVSEGRPLLRPRRDGLQRPPSTKSSAKTRPVIAAQGRAPMVAAKRRPAAHANVVVRAKPNRRRNHPVGSSGSFIGAEPAEESVRSSLETDEWAQLLQPGRADTRDVGQLIHGREWAVGLTIGDYVRGYCRAYARQ